MPIDPWLEKIGSATWPHRRGKAEEYMCRARERAATLRAEGASSVDVREARRWYTQRARGQYLRIDRVETCGAEALEFTCGACGKKHERPARCRVHLLCVACRSVVATEKRVRFLAARETVLLAARRRGLLAQIRRGGRWTEKLLTLTAPHVREDTIARRIERIFSAWTAFLKIFNAHLRAIGGHASARWFRVVEWTIGHDALGHPHLHVWLFCPFLDVDQVRVWWARALAGCGCPIDHPVIDIRVVDDDEGIARELIKYLCKDIDAQGDKVPPEAFAVVYATLDKHRLTQASAGFMALAGRQPRRCECGEPFGRPKRRRAAAAPTG